MHGIQAQGKWGARPGAPTPVSAHFHRATVCRLGKLTQLKISFPEWCRVGALTQITLTFPIRLAIESKHIPRNLTS